MTARVKRRPLWADRNLADVGNAVTAFDNIAAAGAVVQSVFGSYATNADITATIPLDDTIPQIGEGTEIISVSITPKHADSKLRCRFTGQVQLPEGITAAAAIFGTANGNGAFGATHVKSPSAAGAGMRSAIGLEAEYLPAVTTAQTVAVRAGSDGTIRFNGTASVRLFGGVSNATLVVEEIKV